MRLQYYYLVGICVKPSTSISILRARLMTTTTTTTMMAGTRSRLATTVSSSSCTDTSTRQGRSSTIQRRKLIVDTDLGLDDLVALSILRVQQCILQHQCHTTATTTTTTNNTNNHQYHPPSSSHQHHHHTPFQIHGVTITPGISHANQKNAALLRRLLPPNTPVYVSGNTTNDNDDDDVDDDTWMDRNKPNWWTRTSHRVSSFLSSLPPPPPLPAIQPMQPTDLSDCTAPTTITAEAFIAKNMDDPTIDVLCMAPLTTISNALNLQSSSSSSVPEASFYIMGGIRSDSKLTKRGESTAPFGYYDVVEGEASCIAAAKETDNDSSKAPSSETTTAVEDGCDECNENDQFGEFNFALNITAARNVLSHIPTRIIPLEGCTLVPKMLRRSAASTENAVTLSSILSRSKHLPCSTANNDAAADDDTDDETDDGGGVDSANELHVARSILLKLLHEYGTTETQWDSIAAAIYCNAFGTACVAGVVDGDDNDDDNNNNNPKNNVLITRVDSKELKVSELGALSFPGCRFDERISDGTAGGGDGDDNNDNNSNNNLMEHRCYHWIYPTFSTEDESAFFDYLSFLLYSDGGHG